MQINEGFNHSIKISSKNEFVVGTIININLMVGQKFVENKTSFPEEISSCDYLIHFTINCKGKQQAEYALKNLKALSTLLFLQTFLANFGNDIKVNFKTDESETNILMQVCLTSDFVQNTLPFVEKYDLFENFGSGYFEIDLQTMFSPILLLTGSCIKLRSAVFHNIISFKGDEQLRIILTKFAENIFHIFHDCVSKENTIIKNKLSRNIKEGLQNILTTTGEINHDQVYDTPYFVEIWKELDMTKNIVATETSCGHKRCDIINVQEKFNYFINNDIKAISEGFFGPYLKIIECFDFDNFNISFYNNSKAKKISLAVNISEFTKFINDKCLCFLKNNK